MRHFKIIATASAAMMAASLCIPPTLADDMIKTGRYARVTNDATGDQQHPLHVIVQTRIPHAIDTVGGAVDFLLSRSGYQLADRDVLTREARRLMAYPLPETHRRIGPITLDKALMLLAGQGYRLVVDPINRRVAYVVDADFVREVAGDV